MVSLMVGSVVLSLAPDENFLISDSKGTETKKDMEKEYFKM